MQQQVPRTSYVLPPDFLADASRRLGIAALTMGALFLTSILFAPTMEAAGHPLTRLQLILEVLGLAVSVGVFWLSRGHFRPQLLLNLGLAYEVFIAFCVAVSENLPSVGLDPEFLGVSTVCVVIVVFPSLVPATPWKTLGTALVAASMGPLAFYLTRSPEEAALAPWKVAFAFGSNYVIAFVAMATSTVICRLAADVREARELGSYWLEEKLGEGGMGEVWKASHRMLTRPAAIKLIRPAVLSVDPGEAEEIIRRFEREAQATGQLLSPHTVTLHDFGVAPDGTFYYVMELLQGVDLDSLVSRFGPVPPERAVFLLQQMCLSLEEAHGAGLVHRDVKPANVFACRLGTQVDFVKVLDFGLVKVPADRSGALGLTVGNVICGTPAFMSPEQSLGDPVDARSDIYSLGCVAYWLVTGAPVFEADTPVKMLLAHSGETPQPPSRRAPQTIVPELEAVIMACLEKRPSDRPTDAQELGRRLAACPVHPTWDAQRALEWWDKHLPAGAGSHARATEPTLLFATQGH
ncbi:MAG: serine/threonine protein kinase [Armatimonadetes bacterium]|nr:serine/threonine protein kinase [Armatimonadota bacterium]